MVGAVVAALVPATYLVAHEVVRDPSEPAAARSSDLPIPPVSTGSTPAVTPSVPGPSPTASAEQLPTVEADAPRRISSGDGLDAGFDSAVGTLDASSDAEVTRWEPRGSPGSPGTDTVYVVGRVRTDRDSAFAALPRLVEGGKISIRTDAGTMTYTVTHSGLARGVGLGNHPLFTTHQPGRLVLVGIRYDTSGNRLPQALVVTAELSGAQAS